MMKNLHLSGGVKMKSVGDCKDFVSKVDQGIQNHFTEKRLNMIKSDKVCFAWAVFFWVAISAGIVIIAIIQEFCRV